MPDDRDATFIGPDGQQARVQVIGERFSVDIDWGGTTERWDQSVGSPEAAAELYDDYAGRLAVAGFRPAGGPHGAGRLQSVAALKVAEQLRQDGDAYRADVIAADLNDDAEGVRRAVEALSGVRSALELACIASPISRLGSAVWAYDDDGAGHPPERFGVDPVWTELASALRRRPATALHVQCFGPVAPMLDAVSAARATLTHAVITPTGSGALEGLAPPPGLLALTGPATTLHPWLGAPEALPDLEAVTLVSLDGRLRSMLDAVRALPALRHLGVWHTTRAELLAVASDPVVQRLESLDLWSIEPSPPLAALRDRMGEWTGLRRVFLGGHRVSDAARASLEAFPFVRFVSHDRIEVLGHDLMRVGFPGATR
jgi:hypothetical protein